MVIFESLYQSFVKDELLMLDGGFCHFHVRKDGQLTIWEMFSNKPGMGTEILERLKKTPGIITIFAKCPADLKSNHWYQKKGFILEAVETWKTGRKVNHWRLFLVAPERFPRRKA